MSRSKPSAFGRLVVLLTDVAAGVAAFGILVVVLIQVASRLLGLAVPWTEEGTRYLFIWMVFLGLSAGFRTVEVARVTVFVAALPRLLGPLALPIYVGASVLFFALMGWTGLNLVRQQAMMNETAATLAMRMWTIGIVIPLAAGLATLAIVDSVRTRRHLIALPDPAGLRPGEDPGNRP